jgi:hypothetical protein
MLLKTVLISSLLVVIGCAIPDIPKSPNIKEILEVDAVRNICVPYQVVKKYPFTIGDSQEPRPMLACDGYVAISYDDFQKLIAYQNQLVKYANDHKACFKK